jgi:uncharacterized protein (TIGR00369 family)
MQFPRVIPFAEAQGFELLRFEAGEAEIAVSLRPDHCNTWQVAHGGLTMTLLDVVMAHASRAPTPGQPVDDRGVVTLEMKTSFMRPGVNRLISHGKLLHRTSSLAFCEGRVVDEAGELIAHATGTFKYLRGLPVGGRIVQRSQASD